MDIAFIVLYQLGAIMAALAICDIPTMSWFRTIIFVVFWPLWSVAIAIVWLKQICCGDSPGLGPCTGKETR